MSEKIIYNDYDNFAWFYNRYWSERLIDNIFWIVEEYLLKRLPPGGRILDLCCGNAHLSARMVKAGFKVTGVDGSSEMLQYAGINCPEAEYLHCDAIDIKFEGIFDAVISTCDSLSHVMNFDDLTKIFSNVYRALKPGGLFLFDLNNDVGYKKNWVGGGGRAEPDNVYLVRLSYDEKVFQGIFEITMFRLIDGIWLRSDVKLTQQWHPYQMVIEALKQVGFRSVDNFDCDKDLAAGNTGRDMFLAYK